MRKAGISTKLLSIAVLTAVGLMVLTAGALIQLRSIMIEDRIAKVRNLVEVAVGTLSSLDDRAKAGEFSQATAQAMAREQLRSVRYDGSNYFFIVTNDGTYVLLPPSPQVEGTSGTGLTDVNGVKIVLGLLDGARTGNPLFYVYPRLKGGDPSPKVSYAAPFAPWGWVVGTGIYIDDVDAQFKSAMIQFAGVFVLVTVAVVAVVLLLARSIGGGVVRLVAVTERLAARDYAVQVPETGRGDEIGRLARTVVVLRDEAAEAERLKLDQDKVKAQAEELRRADVLAIAQRFERSVKSVADAITASAGDLEGAANMVSGAVDEASAQASNVAGAAEQASQNVATVAVAADQLSASIQEISRQVQASSQVSKDAVDEAERTNDMVSGLAASAGRIGEVVRLINDIASQTNLLALNATIEAARAGDAGKGFAVVANEVKSLATQTAKATEDISRQISEVQGATQQAVDAIRTIGVTISRINEIAGAIAAAVEEQGAATAEIARNVQQAASGTAEVTGALGNLSSASSEAGASAAGMLNATQALLSEAQSLRGEVDTFLVGIRA